MIAVGLLAALDGMSVIRAVREGLTKSEDLMGSVVKVFIRLSRVMRVQYYRHLVCECALARMLN